MKQITWKELCDMMEVENILKQKLEANPNALGFIVFENLQMDSSSFGQKTAVVFGPDNAYKKPADAARRWLYDLPSQRQYATSYYYKE